MDRYFDEYFDMVYLINIPTRVDKYQHSMRMFEKLNITKWQHVIPMDAESIIGDFELAKTAMSCKLSHLECYKDAVDKGYKHILIFEDDFCFNIDDKSIEENLEYHLKVCFTFLQTVDWNLFYFDNMVQAKRVDNIMLSYYRLKSINEFQFVQGKRYTHSYALSNEACKEMIKIINKNQNGKHDHVDKLLEESGIKKTVVYTKGLFDQLINLKSDNDWDSQLNEF